MNTPDNCYLDKGHDAHDLLGPGESCTACGFTKTSDRKWADTTMARMERESAPRELAEAVARLEAAADPQSGP